MKIKHILFVFLLSTLIWSCTEVGPKINIAQTDRVVLVEEFTGVQCVNCPDGSKKLQEILTAQGDKVIAISIHGGNFAVPLPESKYDFRTDDGSELLPYLNAPNNGPIGYPSAIVNRKWFSGQQDRMLFLSEWAGFVSAELQEAPKVRIDMNKDYNTTSRELSIDLDLFFFEAIANDVNVSIVITEDEIVDYQKDTNGKVPDYVHKHVLRDVITTNYRGDLVAKNVAANSDYSYNYTYTLPDGWHSEHCHVVAFVSRNDGGTLDVLQAAQAHLE